LIKPKIIKGNPAFQITDFGIDVSVFLNLTRNYPFTALEKIIKQLDKTEKSLEKLKTQIENMTYEGDSEHALGYYKGKISAYNDVLDEFPDEVKEIRKNEK
jgi:hypothetical protein